VLVTTLTLPMKGVYFDQIAAGQKPEEYRQATAYWRRRLEGRSFDRIVLTRGYPKGTDHDRILVLPWRGLRLTTITHEHFGPNPVEVFAINVSRIRH
jgi:hypothetical protein